MDILPIVVLQLFPERMILDVRDVMRIWEQNIDPVPKPIVMFIVFPKNICANRGFAD